MRLAMILLFTSTDFLGSTGKAIYAFVTYVILLAGVDTATMVPYNAMIGTTTSNPSISATYRHHVPWPDSWGRWE